ncbi:hypothetical protein [Streptomyces sp. NPDC002644]
MAETTDWESRLAELAAEGSRSAAPQAAERIRARGDRRRRRRRAAAVSGGLVLAAAAATVITLGGPRLLPFVEDSAPAPVATRPPVPDASPFVPPKPVPGQEYAGELAYLHDPVLVGDRVRVTVEQLRAGRGAPPEPTGVVHRLTLSPQIPVEVEDASGGAPGDVRPADLLDRLRTEPRRAFVIDYDGEGRVQSLREAFWLN